MTNRSALRIDWVLVAILLGALLLRLTYPALVSLPPRTPLHGFVIDEPEYYGAASVLADGRGLSFYDTFPWTRVPAYPLLVGALFLLFGRQVAPVFVVQAILSVATLAGLAWLAGRIAARAPALGLSRRAATRGAALLGALWLPFTLFANLLLSETLFLAFIVAAVVVLAAWADGPPRGLRIAERGLRSDATLPQSFAGVRAGGLLFGAGLLLGLAALTRSTALAFVPLVALWVAWIAWRGRSRSRAGAVGGGAVVLLGAMLVQAPQMAYNYVAYHHLILGDTSSGYNLWLASVGVKDGGRLVADLQAIPDPGARQAYAYSQAFAQIAAHPGDFLGKGLKESLDLWRINFTSEERQVGGFIDGRVPAAHLWSLLAGEDLLYVLLVLAALLGLAAGPPDPLKALAGLWTLLWMAMAFVFFAVTRFRVPVVALLLPWAPLGFAYLWRLLPVRLAAQAAGPVPRPSRRALGLFVLGAAFLILVVPTIPWPETADGAARWAAQRPYREAVPLVQTDPAQAAALLNMADTSIVATLFARDAARLNGLAAAPAPDSAALQQLAAQPEISLGSGSTLSGRFEPFLLSGAIARLRGDTAGARTASGARPVHADGPDAVDWAATFLPPPRANRLDVGSDLDFGAVEGFYASEQAGQGSAAITYRWSGPQSHIHFQAPSPGSQVVIRWSGARPPGVPAAQVQVRFFQGGMVVASQEFTLPATDSWQETTVLQLPAPVTAVDLSLDSTPFVPGGYDPRALGVRVDWVELR